MGMTFTLNGSTGLPKGTGALQIRGKTYWMIYTDAAGRKIQANTHTADFARARRTLAKAYIGVIRVTMGALQAVAGEKATAGTRGDHPAARGSRQGADGKGAARVARTGRTDPREVGA